MQSATFISSGLWPWATARQTMSRSVMIPAGAESSSLSTTGIAPQSSSTIIRAAFSSDVSRVQLVGLAVMISCTRMAGAPYFDFACDWWIFERLSGILGIHRATQRQTSCQARMKKTARSRAPSGLAMNAISLCRLLSAASAN
jgi:hypothetical protein